MASTAATWTGQLRANGTLATYTARERADRCTAAIGCQPSSRGNVFVAEPTGNLVSRIIVSDDGRSLRGRKAYDNAEFLASTDERFRPVYLSSAPDGTIYVVDLYHGIIQHKGYITEYLRDHIVAHKLEAPVHMGRIFRIVHDTTRRDGTAESLERVNRHAGRDARAPQRLVARYGAAAPGPAATIRRPPPS